MNINDWPIGKILQLPDHVFGRRFTLSCSLQCATGAAVWDISEIALPERCVLWEVDVYSAIMTGPLMWYRMAIGDQLPTTVAEMDGLEPLIHGMGVDGPEPRRIWFPRETDWRINRLKFPISAAGRRLVIECGSGETANPMFMVTIVVSTIPRDIPECYNF